MHMEAEIIVELVAQLETRPRHLLAAAGVISVLCLALDFSPLKANNSGILAQALGLCC